MAEDPKSLPVPKAPSVGMGHAMKEAIKYHDTATAASLVRSTPGWEENSGMPKQYTPQTGRADKHASNIPGGR